ncbi:MAG: metal-sensing transcriptional repressor [Anaerovoracaceae bacterium]
MDNEAKKDSCPCCSADASYGRTTQRSADEKKKLINRLSRIEGQIRGIRSMVEKDAYCVDILTQSAAAGAALDAFSRQVLSRHMHTCVAEDIREGNDETIDELMDILQKLMK